jgi:hypothetical protein
LLESRRDCEPKVERDSRATSSCSQRPGRSGVFVYVGMRRGRRQAIDSRRRQAEEIGEGLLNHLPRACASPASDPVTAQGEILTKNPGPPAAGRRTLGWGRQVGKWKRNRRKKQDWKSQRRALARFAGGRLIRSGGKVRTSGDGEIWSRLVWVGVATALAGAICKGWKGPELVPASGFAETMELESVRPTMPTRLAWKRAKADILHSNICMGWGDSGPRISRLS